MVECENFPTDLPLKLPIAVEVSGDTLLFSRGDKQEIPVIPSALCLVDAVVTGRCGFDCDEDFCSRCGHSVTVQTEAEALLQEIIT